MTATQRLAALDAKVDEAQARYTSALDTLRRSEHTSSAVDVLTPLYDFHHGVETRQREADPDELKRLTADACERIVDEGLVFFVPTPGQLRIVDPSYEDEVTAARDALNAARTARTEYEVATRDEREAEAKAARDQEFSEAVNSGDADRVRAILNPTTDALTTADLNARPVTGTVFHHG